MTTDITSTKWRGDFAEQFDPRSVHFTAIEAPQPGECAGCIFRTLRMSGCSQAADIAEELELPACSPNEGPSYIYVLDTKTDLRQIRVKQDGCENQVDVNHG